MERERKKWRSEDEILVKVFISSGDEDRRVDMLGITSTRKELE